MGNYYDKLHFSLRRMFDRWPPRTYRLFTIALFSLYGLLSCFFTVKFLEERNHPHPAMKQIIDSSIRTDSILMIKPIKNFQYDKGKG